MSRAHVLALPYPAQGHVKPLMDLSCALVKHGIKVTFVNTDFNHKQIMKAQEARVEEGQEQQVGIKEIKIKLVSIPDGLGEDEDRNCLEKLTQAICEVMPKQLEKLIQEINEQESEESEKISCVVADGSMGWALEVAERMGIQRASFWPASASLLALSYSIPKLLLAGIIDSDGTPAKDEIIHLGPKMPAMRTTNFVWTQIGDDLNAQKIVFNYMIRNNKDAEIAEWVICNSTHELEPSAFAFASQIVPIGPLQASKSKHFDHLAGSFWPEDSTCLKWLDQQPDKSVIYVAFGSFTIFDLLQLQELALGLELSNKPFLWVVRSDINNGENYAFMKAFKNRLSSLGKIVCWAPQQKVLRHPSIACFISHCGWNSTTEGLINGVPFLCWPYFADQFLNETYICDIWKVGLRLNCNDDGKISHEEITCKIMQILHEQGFRGRASQLKEIAISSVKEGGSSNKNLNNFVDWIKKHDIAKV